MDIRGRKMKKPPACAQCRRRKVGCDRVRPVCGNCARAGKGDCFYPDVPGQYIQNNGGSPLPQNGNGRPEEISTVDQIREYNTRLQLSNMDGNELPQAPKQYIPRTSTFPHNKEVPSGSSMRSNVNWVQGPAIFVDEGVNYGQDEAVLKELEFIKKRLMELKEISGRDITGINLDWTVTKPNDTIETKKNKKRKENFLTDAEFDLESGYESEFNKYRDMDPSFLDDSEIFDILENCETDTHRDEIMGYLDSKCSNDLFNFNTVCCLDPFLHKQFLKRIDRTVCGKYQDNLKNWKEKTITGSQYKKPTYVVKFPNKANTKEFINIFNSIVQESSSLIPILNLAQLPESIEKLFSMGSTFDVTKHVLSQLFQLGEINICLLLCYQAIVSSVLINLTEEMNIIFQEIKAMFSILESNIFTINSEIERRSDVENHTEYLRYTALWKFYFSISPSFADSVDYNEDVNLGISLGTSHEHSDTSNILLWNFIEKNYQYRTLFRGQIPKLTLSQPLNTAFVRDPLYDIDKKLLSHHGEIISNLLSRDEKLPISRVEEIKNDLNLEISNIMKHLTTVAANISNVNDTILTKNLSIYLTYFLMLQYEKENDVENYKKTYLDFIMLTQETIFYIFSNFANMKFTGHEFVYINKFFKVLESIAIMYLGGYERSERQYSKLSDENAKQENRFHSGLCFLILQKLHMLVRDYSKNCKVVNPLATKLLSKLETIMSHRFEPVEIERKNIFESISTDLLRLFNTKLYRLSESLVKKEFYEGGVKYDPNHWDTMGITENNIDAVIDTYYSCS